MLLFSATFEDSVWRFAEQVVPDPNIIRLKREEETLDTIKQFYVVCREKEDKFTALCNLYGSLTIAQAMIFCHVSQLFYTLHYDLMMLRHLHLHLVLITDQISVCKFVRKLVASHVKGSSAAVWALLLFPLQRKG